MKKLLNILLILVMLLTIVPVNAASGSSQAGDKGSITISNAVTGETYNAYKIFDVASYDTDKKIASYKVSEPWLTFVQHYDGLDEDGKETTEEPKYFKLTDSDTTGVKYIQLADGVTLTDVQKSDFAKAALAYATSTSTSPAVKVAATEEATSETVKFEDLDLGYYLVDSSLGALCSLNTTTPDATIKEKNEPTKVDKIITGKLVLDDKGKEASATVGTNVPYKVTLTQIYQVKNLVFEDTFGPGLTSNKDFRIFVGDTETELSTDYYTVTANTESSLIIKFKDAYTTTTLTDKNASLVIKYTATVNASALTVDSANNTATITFGNNQTSSSETDTYTYGFNIQKTDGTNNLAGAYFILKDADKNMIKLAYDTTNKIYRPVVGTEAGNSNTFNGMDSKYAGYAIAVDNTGLATIKGLSNGTYYLEEIKAPEGYNKLAQDKKVTIEEKDTTLTAELDTTTVVNTSGAILPSTGGMGTVLFITIGSLMVLGFGVLLVTKFRMSKVNA